MRLALDPRAARLLRRVPRTSPYSVAEILLLSLLAVQCARLFWTLVTPVGPVGDWRPAAPRSTAGSAVLAEFDPFFRLADPAGESVAVTSLELKLFGIRQDQASGRGSAIVGTPDGQQKSYAVGEEIVPGVTLTGVAFDHITISREGTTEQLFMDQSGEAAVVGEAPPTGPPPPQVAPPPSVMTPDSPAAPAQGNAATDISFAPRVVAGELSGFTVSPAGKGEAFRAAKLKPGDVIVGINGRRISGADRGRDMSAEFSNRHVVIQVERNGQVMTLRPGDAE